MKNFGETSISITLLGEEWFALMARILGHPLSPEGSRVYRRAADKLSDQLSAASDKVPIAKHD
jgi:hypothetical protein